jgi:hypothetical protein
MKKVNFQTLIFPFLCGLLLFTGCRQNSETANYTETNSGQSTAIRVSSPDTNAAEPAVAADSGGNVYVVYLQHKADKTADIY